MDAGAFGLSRNPFQRIPELDDACLPNTVASLLSELQSALRSPQGVSVLVGETGSGKTMAAAAFARRLAGAAQTALILHPTSSVAAIARDAMILFGANMEDGDHGEDWIEALMATTMRRARSGRPTVIIVDDAHRLSPQTLEDLADLFDEDQPALLHLFLFGRPKLLDRMHAGPERALHAHLLQVGRLEPLGLRECVRYLERRVALYGGELGGIFHEGAIDELVRVSAGRLVHLEQNALAALERASRKHSSRVMAEDVRPMARPLDEEEHLVKPTRQQPLRFEIPNAIDDRDSEWRTGDEAVEDEEDVQDLEDVEDAEDAEDEWGASGDDASREWGASDEQDDEESFEEAGLSWESAAPHLDEDDDSEDERRKFDAFARRPGVAMAGEGRRRLIGRAVLSLTACVGLVWAANHLPGPAADSAHGRDAKLFAERLSSKPSDILRVAQTAEEADASAQMEVWKAQPPRSTAPANGARPGTVASIPTASSSVETATAGTRSGSPADSSPMGPAVPALKTETVSVPKAAAAQVAAVSRPTVRTPAARSAVRMPPSVAKPQLRSASRLEPVFTVQLGAFKARSNAEQFATRLRGKPARIVRDGGFYRVYSGTFANKREAAVHEALLKRQGFSTFVTTAVF